MLKKIKVKIVKLFEKYYELKYNLIRKPTLNYELEFRNICFILTWPLGIGDLIMLTPTIKSFKKNFPNSKITLITNYDIFDINDFIDDIILVKGNNLGLITEFSNIGEKFDLGIILARSVNQVTYLNKLNCRFHLGYLGGFKVSSNFKLFSDIEKFDINKHFSYVGFNICNSLNLKIDKTLMSMNYPSSVVNNVNKFKKNLEFDDSKPIIGLNTNVHWESRRWSEDNYISLVERLYDKFNFVLLGGPGPDEILNNYIEKNLLDKGIKIFNSTSKLKLIELPQFISTLDFMITSDSGPMHIGILMRTPTLALFGPIDPNLRFPFDYKKNHIIDYLWYLDYAKGGVYDYHSEYVDKNMNGLKAISVEFVCEKTLNFFKNNKFTYIK